eukprot:GHUV01012812.1.p1 GENE.GHUV01012812.1~~GHUV01012812.1.p1  ORF type:complete len:151 (+),score=40.55 GHUV01012812.1:651-1103(+)
MSEAVITSNSPGCTTNVHLLPFGIAYDGAANVEEYFIPASGVNAAGAQQWTAQFRGRQLKGAQRQLPDGYQGFILKPSGQTAAAAADTEQRSWQTTQMFSQLTVWNHDLAPGATDWHNRCIDWLAVADKIQASITTEQVQQELAAMQQQQ